MIGEKRFWQLVAAFGCIITATLGYFVRNISEGNDEVIILGRFGIGFICLAIMLVIKGESRKIKTTKLSRPLVFSGIFMALLVVFYIKALQTGTLANAGFLLYLGPLIATGLVAVWGVERLTREKAILLACAALGTLFITEFKSPWNSAQADSFVYGIFSGVFYGLYLYFNNQHMQREVSGPISALYQFLIGSLIMLPIVVFTGTNLVWQDIAWIVAIGVIHGFFALTLVISALKHLETNEYGTISYLEPVGATIIGLTVYNEGISTVQGIGCALIFVAGTTQFLVSEHTVEKGIWPRIKEIFAGRNIS